MNSIKIATIQALQKAATEFIQLKGEHKIFAFYGEMGAGKTTFVKALCAQLGTNDNVSSPTFALVNDYLLPDEAHIYHFDFYRINKVQEAVDMGFDDYLYSDSYCLIEWPEMIEELLPDNSLKVHIKILDDGSRVLEF